MTDRSSRSARSGCWLQVRPAAPRYKGGGRTLNAHVKIFPLLRVIQLLQGGRYLSVTGWQQDHDRERKESRAQRHEYSLF